MTDRSTSSAGRDFIQNDSALARQVQQFDWSQTPLGPVECWPAELKAAVAQFCGASVADVPEVRSAGHRAVSLLNPAHQATSHEEEIIRLNRELQSRVSELQTVLDLVPVGVGIAHDPNCLRITHNPYISELLGVEAWQNASLSAPPEEQVFNYQVLQDGKPVSPDQLPMQVACTGVEVNNFEFDLIRPGQDPVRLSSSSRPLRDEHGRIRGSVGAILDITERVRSDRRLKEKNERLRLLSEAAAQLLLAEDPDTMLRRLFAKIGPHLDLDTYFNFMVNETGDSLRLESCIGIPDETAAGIRQLEFGQAVCGNVALFRKPIIATDIQHSDDPRVQLVKSFGLSSYACNPLMSGDKLLGTLSFASRRRTHFDANELEFLQTICHYVTVAYERVRLIQQLREADRRKDEFLATLAHELRNPLAPIRNALELLRIADDDRAVREEARALMERQLVRMVRLIDDLLEISRITRGKLQLRLEHVDLTTVMQNAIEASRPVLDSLGHELIVTLPTRPTILHADATRLAQVFANLLDNAAKYTDPGGKIWLTAQCAGSEVVISVRDSGIGISPEHLPRLFEMFSQAQSAIERSQGGLGIGLALVKGLTELHGGHVEARSPGLGRGSEFIVRLPREVDAAARLNAVPVRAAHSTQRMRILVVDDNRDSANSMSLVLRTSGHLLERAYDGLEAVKVAEVFRPDAMLLDIGMPKLNGYDAARIIRQQPWGKQICLIALTGWGQEEDKRRANEAGFNFHLTKPVVATTVAEILAKLSDA